MVYFFKTLCPSWAASRQTDYRPYLNRAISCYLLLLLSFEHYWKFLGLPARCCHYSRARSTQELVYIESILLVLNWSVIHVPEFQTVLSKGMCYDQLSFFGPVKSEGQKWVAAAHWTLCDHLVWPSKYTKSLKNFWNKELAGCQNLPRQSQQWKSMRALRSL